MKLSLAWLFDHIAADWRTIDVNYVIGLLNSKTAEIEGCTRITIDAQSLLLAQVHAMEPNTITMKAPQINQTVHLSVRKEIGVGSWYLIKKEPANAYRWATIADLGGDKDGLLPAIEVTDNNYQHALDQLEYQDYILQIDNKSITHRPDLWGHRGFAQEIALLLDLPLKPLDQFLHQSTVQAFDTGFAQTAESGCGVAIKTSACYRFASLYIPQIDYCSSLLWMAGRLSRIDTRSIDFLVDCTNYVMSDIGQPMHAFDAQKLADTTLIVRNAQAGEQLVTLDGDTLKLVPDDVVIADEQRVLSLAGVMGGNSTGVTASTQSLLIESASFNATAVRRAALRHKKRTEASARFEKGLDPNQNIIALERYTQLLHEAGVAFQTPDIIFSVGQPSQPKTIDVTHTFLQNALGVTLDPVFVQNILTRLGCTVSYKNDVYTVHVPTNRSTKDITIKEDILEEVGRLYGYGNITPQLPTIAAQPADLTALKRLRVMKQFLAATAHMHEVQNYAFFDESFLPLINWQPVDAVQVQNPVSSNWDRLVTTLVPGLVKAVYDNVATERRVRFFEVGRIWSGDKHEIFETSRATGIFFDQDDGDTFYTVQQYVQELFTLLGMHIEWQQVTKPAHLWFAPYRTAAIMHNAKNIGTLGVVDPYFLQQIIKGGSAIIFDLDLSYIQQISIADAHYTELSKFPAVSRDISLLVPLHLRVNSISNMIRAADKRIITVDLIDSFVHEKWPDQRALTIRFIISDHHKTLTKQEVDDVVTVIAQQLAQHTIVVR